MLPCSFPRTNLVSTCLNCFFPFLLLRLQLRTCSLGLQHITKSLCYVKARARGDASALSEGLASTPLFPVLLALAAQPLKPPRRNWLQDPAVMSEVVSSEVRAANQIAKKEGRRRPCFGQVLEYQCGKPHSLRFSYHSLFNAPQPQRIAPLTLPERKNRQAGSVLRCVSPICQGIKATQQPQLLIFWEDE